jgi:hypothetical protein
VAERHAREVAAVERRRAVAAEDSARRAWQGGTRTRERPASTSSPNRPTS